MSETQKYISLLPHETCDGCQILEQFGELLAKHTLPPSIPHILICMNVSGREGLGPGPARQFGFFLRNRQFSNFLSPINRERNRVDIAYLAKSGADMDCPHNLEQAPPKES